MEGGLSEVEKDAVKILEQGPVSDYSVQSLWDSLTSAERLKEGEHFFGVQYTGGALRSDEMKVIVSNVSPFLTPGPAYVCDVKQDLVDMVVNIFIRAGDILSVR